MGLFDIFKKKNSVPPVKDLVWMSHDAKLAGSLKLLKEHPAAMLIAWFSQTENEYKQFFQQNGITAEIKMAKGISSFMVTGKTVIFLEHYPLHSKEENLVADWQTENIFVLSALDEPLFQQFGGERITVLMKQLGMQEDEHIEHSMVSKSIVNAQHKLEQKAGVEILANSSAEWFKKNIHA